jgi:hypothetical protein
MNITDDELENAAKALKKLKEAPDGIEQKLWPFMSVTTYARIIKGELCGLCLIELSPQLGKISTCKECANIKEKNPPPPAIGDVFHGPPISHGSPVFKNTPGRYYVRAIVDAEEDPEFGWLYQIVFRLYTRHKGWRYIIEDGFVMGTGQYKKISKGKRAR